MINDKYPLTSLTQASVLVRHHPIFNCLFVMLMLLGALQTMAKDAPLEVPLKDAQLLGIQVESLPGGQVEVALSLDRSVELPRTFSISNPNRIVLDFHHVTNQGVPKHQDVDIGPTHSVHVVEAKQRLRVVLNMTEMVPYQVTQEGQRILLTLGDKSKQALADNLADPALEQSKLSITHITPPNQGIRATASAKRVHSGIHAIDFRRGPKGEGRVIIRLADPSTPMDIRQESGKVIVELMEIPLDQRLRQRLDVTDFATPVKLIDTDTLGGNVLVSIEALADYQYLAYQVGNVLTIELKSETPKSKKALEDEEIVYQGQPLSLSFPDTEVRTMLQLLADYAGFNLVVSDSVGGRISLRLREVPWDQAMDIILKVKGLGKRQTGNVMIVAPAEELAAREQQALESDQQVQELAPLRSEYIQVNYAKAADLSVLLKGETNSLLSARGNVSVDERTNILLVQDTAMRLEQVRDMIARLDIPVKQVLIEARVVVVNSNYSHEIGVRFGFSDRGTEGAISGSLEGGISIFDNNNVLLNDSLAVNLPISNPAGSLGVHIARLTDGTILDLELSALESENIGKIISSPKLITANQKEALIESGEEIPFLQSTSSGAASISFKKAVLSLRVTPQITPDNRIILDLVINQDTRGEDTPSGPAINTQEIRTQVLVNNGETIVLGGIYQQTKTESERRVPWLGEIPFIKHLFRSKVDVDNRNELLVFVTPKIIQDSFSQ